jgi:hypothetical protein
MKLQSITTTGITLSLMGLLLGAAEKAEAASFSFTKIADSNTLVPSGTNNFFNFDVPSIDGGRVVFRGSSFDNEGIYTNFGGSLNVLADRNTPFPGGTGTFGFFSPTVSLEGQNVAFLGRDNTQFSDQEAIFTNIGGSLNVVADRNTPIPGGRGNFSRFALNPSLSNGNVAFVGRDSNFLQRDPSGQEGVYTNIGGSLNVVADTNTSIPGGNGKFTYFEDASLDNGSVAFIGQQGNSSLISDIGIYTNIGGSLNVVADKTSSVPGGTGTFGYFDGLSFKSGHVAFRAFGSGGETGIYTNIGGSLNMVADTNTLIPGETGTFNWFALPSFDGQNVAFLGSMYDDFYSGSGYRGIYTNLGGSLTKVIDLKDSLDGKTLKYLDISRQGLSGDAIAFRASFTDGSQGIYVAKTVSQPVKSVPEPTATLGLLAFGAFSAGSMLKRQQKKQIN